MPAAFVSGPTPRHTRVRWSRKWQIDRGAIGICCAKLGEAEVFADAGIKDIRLPYPINPSNADRVIALLDRTHLSFIVDHPVVARQWSDAMTRAGKQVDVLVKIDVGFHRCGIDPDSRDALTIDSGDRGIARAAAPRACCRTPARPTTRTPKTNCGRWPRPRRGRMSDLAERCRKNGRADRRGQRGRDAAGALFNRAAGFTEYRPGNYVYFDRTQVALGAATIDDCALTVLATVVSKPAPNRVILDSGSKTLTNDGARGFTPIAGHGTVLRLPEGKTQPGRQLLSGDFVVDDDLLIERLSEEHATVRVLSGATDP